MQALLSLGLAPAHALFSSLSLSLFLSLYQIVVKVVAACVPAYLPVRRARVYDPTLRYAGAPAGYPGAAWTEAVYTPARIVHTP